MSMITFKTTVCGVCGRKRVELDLASSNIMDGMDLDTRPGEMYRSTMDTWIQECKDCGYVSANLSNGKPEYRTFLESDEFKNVGGVVLYDELATRFYKYALFNMFQNNVIRAFYAFLHAAWVLDDCKNNEGANLCRRQAISLFEKIEEKGKLNEEIILIQADMLRRVSEFSKVAELLKDFHFHDDSYQIIADYQLMLSEHEETACYKEVEAIAYARKRNGLTNDGAESKEITMEDESLKNIKKILCEYDKALTLLDQYDHQNMIRPAGNKSVHSVDYDECKKAIGYMKNNAYTVSDLFGKEKDDSFKSSIANIEQSFNGEEIYKSLEEKAAHLLYFVTKNHSFFDGNKRIAAAMFLYYLNKNDRLFSFGKKRIDDATLAALTVMIAESRPEEMEMMISMVTNCLNL